MTITLLLASVGTVLLALLVGVYCVTAVDRAVAARITGEPRSPLLLAPLHTAARLWHAPHNETETPDRSAWRLAPVLYLVLAAMGLALVPWSRDFVPVDLTTGIVFWGAIEPLATVLIFLKGWASNAHFPLLGGYRYVSLGLSYILVSMFVLIGVALPAESLQVSAVVEAQSELWNVVRQPLGLPLFLIVGLGVSFWGPLNFVDAEDLHGGAASEEAGRVQLLWGLGRAAMLFAFSAIAASAFLGGWHGPWLPGPVWLMVKTLAVVWMLVALGHYVPRVSPERFLTIAWVILLPLAFLDLAWAGVEALL
ncbi:NADH-quinone oxidoreductase subunit H [Marinobacter adhaerens]|uniref:NADH-quinone oxidoreductase subunit H n=1 Tax=Marinobacter adhaerens TaxID=1033846 RepID=A0A851HXD0_9GAMM|nr:MULTISPECIES: NADH-quinone oxidoreductase subunit H [Marinobacter]NWN90641.1 NADH-quinone oxidoreductase subunit H [Marinobacter adhaerens]